MGEEEGVKNEDRKIFMITLASTKTQKQKSLGGEEEEEGLGRKKSLRK